MLAIGLMSGTSLDGVDACLLKINDEKEDKYQLIDFITLDYDENFKKKIMRNLCNETAKLSEISTLNFEISNYFVKAIDKLLNKTNYKYQDISFVASHGQTIWHDPKGEVPSTLQIGEASVISYKTNIKVISNFRSMDIASGGEGAPLVVLADYELFRRNDISVVLQNIGGISNLTYLKKNCTIDDVLAFDTGVGNIMIDYYMNKYYNLPFDKNGDIAFSGVIIKELLDYLKLDSFVYKNPPKSTGRERYNANFMEELVEKFNLDNYNKEDIIRTVSEFTAYTIYNNYKMFLKDIDLVLVSGGGSHNKYLTTRIQEEIPAKVMTMEEYGFNSDAKEAVAFAILGYKTLNNQFGNVISATGAKEKVILGNITNSPR